MNQVLPINNHPRRRRDDYVVDIYKSAVKLLTPASLPETYHIIIAEAIALVGAQYGSIFISDGPELKRVFSTLPENIQGHFTTSIYTARAFSTQKPLIIPAKQFFKNLDSLKISRGQVVLIPLVNDGKSFGVLTAKSLKEVPIDHRRVEALALFGSIAALAITKSRLFDELGEALKTRDLFISMASHELKTPVTAIKGFSQLICNKVSSGERPPDFWCQQLNAEVDRMTRLVSELLQLNQIKAGKLHFNFQSFNFREAVYQAIFDLNQLHPDYLIKVHDHTKGKSDKIAGDRDKLLQAIINLISNAIKYSPIGSKVGIALHADDENIFFEVSDQGPGMDKEILEHLFDEFYRGPNQKKEGLGIGLYLTKKIVEAHKGKISVQSKLNKGTKITITLPQV